MARKPKIKKHGSDNKPDMRNNVSPPRLLRRRNIKSVQAGPRKSTSSSQDRAATPKAPSGKSDRLSLSSKSNSSVFSAKS